MCLHFGAKISPCICKTGFDYTMKQLNEVGHLEFRKFSTQFLFSGPPEKTPFVNPFAKKAVDLASKRASKAADIMGKRIKTHTN